MTITASMLPTKLQLIYDYIHQNETINTNNSQSTITYDQFTKYLIHLKLLNDATSNKSNTSSNHLSEPNNMINGTENNYTYNSEFIHHIFSTYKETSQFSRYSLLRNIIYVNLYDICYGALFFFLLVN